MPNLLDLCNDKRFSETQKMYFWKRVFENSSQDIDSFVVAYNCMREVWVKYDYGGISVGRSLRATLIELAFDCLEFRYLGELEQLIGILIAMYHSPEYINANKWFDYEITIQELPMGERIFLVSAAMALGITFVPDISVCTQEYLLECISKGREKIRISRKAD